MCARHFWFPIEIKKKKELNLQGLLDGKKRVEEWFLSLFMLAKQTPIADVLLTLILSGLGVLEKGDLFWELRCV